MIIKDAAAFQFIFQEEIYLVNSDKTLYNSNTAPGPVEAVQVEAIPDIHFSYLGGNKKNFLVIVHYQEAAVMDAKHLAALESTIKRLGFLLEDVAVFNSAKYPDASLAQLWSHFNPKKLLLLGTNTLLHEMRDLAINKLQKIKNCPALFTYSFAEMMDNTENKKVFWEQMKLL